MDEPIRDLQAELGALLKQGQDGVLDFNTCITKAARKILEQKGCDELLYTLIARLIENEITLGLGAVAHLLTLRILRLEDDVRVLRNELVKGRIGKTHGGGIEHDGAEHKE